MYYLKAKANTFIKSDVFTGTHTLRQHELSRPAEEADVLLAMYGKRALNSSFTVKHI